MENPFLINLQGKFETDTVMKLRLIIRRVMINGVAYELKILFQIRQYTKNYYLVK